MKQRIITGAIYLGILLPLVFINHDIAKIGYLALTMFATFYGTYEIVRAANGHNKLKGDGADISIMKVIIPVLSSFVSFFACLATYKYSDSGFVNYSYYLYLLIAYLASMFVVLCALVLIPNSTMKDFGTGMTALTYGGLMMGLAFSVRYFEPINLNNGLLNLSGTKCFLFVYLIVILTDSFAMIFGCKYGKHRLAPTISPKKSVEGAIAGLVGGIIAGLIVLLGLQIISLDSEKLGVVIAISVVISLIISAAGQFGDLIESKIKRSYEIKDMGNILPGHGGILDRFDSFIFAGLIFYVAVLIIECLL